MCDVSTSRAGHPCVHPLSYPVRARDQVAGPAAGMDKERTSRPNVSAQATHRALPSRTRWRTCAQSHARPRSSATCGRPCDLRRRATGQHASAVHRGAATGLHAPVAGEQGRCDEGQARVLHAAVGKARRHHQQVVAAPGVRRRLRRPQKWPVPWFVGDESSGVGTVHVQSLLTHQRLGRGQVLFRVGKLVRRCLQLARAMQGRWRCKPVSHTSSPGASNLQRTHLLRLGPHRRPRPQRSRVDVANSQRQQVGLRRGADLARRGALLVGACTRAGRNRPQCLPEWPPAGGSRRPSGRCRCPRRRPGAARS